MAGPYNVPMPQSPKVTPEQTMGPMGQMMADLPRHINAGYQGYQMGRQIEADQNQAAMQKDLQGVTAVAGFGKQAGQLNGEYIDTLKTAENSGMTPEQKAVVKEAIKTKYNGLYAQLKAKTMEDPVVAGFIQKSAPPESLDQFGDWHKNANIELMDGMIGVLSKHDPEKAFEMQMAKETYLRELESHKAKDAMEMEKIQIEREKLKAPGKPPSGYRWSKGGSLEAIPGGPAEKKGGLTVTLADGTVIDTSGGGQLPKGAQASVAKEGLNAQEGLDTIESIEQMYKPEYLTYYGKGRSGVSNFLNKLDPESRDAFAKDQQAFISAANKAFIAYRKWATGVAGGEKEMAEIKRATFSEDDSPQAFEAKLAYSKDLYQRLLARANAALAVGIDPKASSPAFKKFIEQNPLSDFSSSQSGGGQGMDVNKRAMELEAAGLDTNTILDQLMKEGY